MMKLAIGILALVVLVGGLITPASAQLPWGWMYLSTEPGVYNCDDNGVVWESGPKTLYLILEAPNFQVGDAFGGIEFSVEFPSVLFHVSTTSPDSPNAVFFGDCVSSPGHCSYGMGAGGPVTDNPWTAVYLDFLNFGAGNNLGFYLGPWDLAGVRSQGGPAWAKYDPNDPPVYIPELGTSEKPGWQQGFVVLNYDQATAPSTPFPEEVYRNETATPWPAFNAGDPCARAKVTATEQSSWGALKAGY